MNHDLFLFDLDGTLSDPMDGFVRSLNYALEHRGHELIEPSAAGRFVGPPLDSTFRALIGEGIGKGIGDARESEVTALVSKYRERYTDVGYTENVLYPGIPESLEHLSAAGASMAVCTSKRVDYAEKILRMHGIDHHFRFADGGDVGIQKWQQIEALIADGRVGGSAIMIGDRAVDLIAGHRNGLHAGGVLWGYGSRAELESESPECLFETPGDLPGLLIESR